MRDPAFLYSSAMRAEDPALVTCVSVPGEMGGEGGKLDCNGGVEGCRECDNSGVLLSES